MPRPRRARLRPLRGRLDQQQRRGRGRFELHFDPGSDLRFRRNRVGGVFLVNTTIDFFQTHPTVSALPWGGFVVSWQDGSQTGDDLLTYAVRAQVFDSAGAKIGAEFLVNKGVENGQGIPVSTVLSSGSFVVGWKETYHDDVGTKARYEGRVFSLTQTDNSGNDTIIGDSQCEPARRRRR